MSARPRLLLVGTGTMGSLHARVIAQHDGAELAGVVDTRFEAAQEVADKYGTAARAEIGSLSGIDAVAVAAATEAHYALAREVLEAGVPLLVEKPLTPSIEDSRALVAYADSQDIPLMCGLLERYNPAIVTARALVDQPVMVRALRHSPYAPRIKTGVAWDLLVHDVDLALGLVPGDVARCQATRAVFSPLSVPGAEDVADAVLTFESGAVANVSASRLSQRKIRLLTVYELERMIEVDLLRKTVTVEHNVSIEAVGPDGRIYRQETVTDIPDLVTGREPLAAQLDRFLDVLAGRADAAAERATILPAHEVVATVLAAADTSVCASSSPRPAQIPLWATASAPTSPAS
ncbi:MAG: Gfo/Idh/MocA family oxidoreductase [Bifidobacteriaceae bacterium]|jgi:predicted dehydrogenase|nr:Gfo/Idh/MocA family oxidoreductase [Bifidobacteriaceae bacterium]